MADSSDLNQSLTEVSDPLVKGVYAVFQHLDNLIAIKDRELLFRPNVGLDLEPFLFRPVDEITAQAIYTRILNRIRNNDDRITLAAGSDVIPLADDKTFVVRLIVEIRGIPGRFEYNGRLNMQERSEA